MQRLGICLNKIPDSCCGSLNVVVLVRSAVGSFPFLRTCNCGSFEDPIKTLQRGSWMFREDSPTRLFPSPSQLLAEGQQKHCDRIKPKKSSGFTDASQVPPGRRGRVLPRLVCFTKTFFFMMSWADLHNSPQTESCRRVEVKFQSVPVVTIWNMSHRVPAHVLTPPVALKQRVGWM